MPVLVADPAEEVARSGHVCVLDWGSDVEPEEAVILIVLKVLIEYFPQYLRQDHFASSQVVNGHSMAILRNRPQFTLRIIV